MYLGTLICVRPKEEEMYFVQNLNLCGKRPV